MGLFASLLNSVTNAASLAYEIHKDQHLTGAQREANEFSAQQADLDRRFQSAEAEKARDWQEQQYLQYNSPAAQVRQYQQAGINPALMFGDPATPASMQTSAPAGASSASVTPSGGDLVGMIGQMLNLSKLDAEIENIREDSRGKRENARAAELQNQLTEKFGEIRAQADYDKVQAEIAKTLEEGKLTKEQRLVLVPAEKALKEANARSLTADALISEWKHNYMEFYGADPSAPPITQALTSFLDWVNAPERLWNRTTFSLPGKN